MKTLKTISTALALTLLVSAVSAPAMETLTNIKTAVVTKAVAAKDYVADTRVANAVAGAVKATDKALFGNVAVTANGDLETQGGVFGLRNLRLAPSFVRAGTVAAIVAAPVIAYATYKYFTAEEVEDAAEEANEPAQNVAPAPVEVSAPVETPVVEAPKAEAKSVRKPKTGVRRMAKAPKSAVSKAGKAKVVVAKAKRNAPAKAKVARNAGCKNGKCGVRRCK